MTIRMGNTWDFAKGTQVSLSYFFRNNALYRRILTQNICEQIELQQKKQEILFFENPLQKAKRYFSEENYYLTHDSVVIFYPLYTIAPYYTGILSYAIPFSKLEKCWVPSRRPQTIPPYEGRFSEKTEQDFL